MKTNSDQSDTSVSMPALGTMMIPLGFFKGFVASIPATCEALNTEIQATAPLINQEKISRFAANLSFTSKG